MEINTQALQQLRSDVGDEVLPLILDRFCEELGQRAEALREALATSDLKGIGLHAHSVKSTARTCGLDEVADCAAETESAVRESRNDDAIQGAGQLIELSVQGVSVLEAAKAAGA